MDRLKSCNLVKARECNRAGGMLADLMFVLMLALPMVDSFNGFLNDGGNEGGLSFGMAYRILVILVFATASFLGMQRRLLVAAGVAVSGIIIIPHIGDLVHSASFVVLTIKTMLPLICIAGFVSVDMEGRTVEGRLKMLFRSWALLFPVTIFIPLIFGTGFNTYGSMSAGYKGFYYSQNDLCFVLVMLFYFSGIDALRSEDKRHSISAIVSVLLTGACILLLGLKSGYIMMLVSAVLWLFDRSVPTSRKRIVVLVAFIAVLILSVLFDDEIRLIVNRWLYNYNVSDSFGTFVSSGRFERIPKSIEKLNAVYGGPFWMLFGAGQRAMEVLHPYMFAEMDVFDILFEYGVAGCLLICGTYLSFLFLRIPSKESWTKCMLVIACAMSTLGGHVLNSPLSGMVFAAVLALIWVASRDDYREESFSMVK